MSRVKTAMAAQAIDCFSRISYSQINPMQNLNNKININGFL
jgi:hypothetical protein